MEKVASYRVPGHLFPWPASGRFSREQSRFSEFEFPADFYLSFHTSASFATFAKRAECPGILQMIGKID